MRLLTVSPLADGWRLSVDGVQNDMVFKSGRAAESAARRRAAVERWRRGRGPHPASRSFDRGEVRLSRGKIRASGQKRGFLRAATDL